MDNELQVKIRKIKLIYIFIFSDDPANNLIDLSSPDTHRTNMTQSEIETQRQHLSHIPTLQQLVNTTGFSTHGQHNTENQLTPNEYDPIVHHLLRYSELISTDLESKPINEKMDHWYLDLKKNLMVN